MGYLKCTDNTQASFKALVLTLQPIWYFTGAINKLNELTFIPRIHSLKIYWPYPIGSSPVLVPALRSTPFLAGVGQGLGSGPR